MLSFNLKFSSNGSHVGVLGPDPLSRAVEAIIRVEQLQSDMEVDLQQMLHFCSQRSSSDMQTVVNSLSSKVGFWRYMYILHCHLLLRICLILGETIDVGLQRWAGRRSPFSLGRSSTARNGGAHSSKLGPSFSYVWCLG